VISFDLFGTLVTVDRPTDPAAAVGRALSDRGIDLPADWGQAYRERHLEVPAGVEVPLPAHVAAALRSRGVDPRGPAAPHAEDPTAPESTPGNVVRRAVVAAFDPTVERLPGAAEAVAAAGERGPVGLLSNCSVPELVGRTLVRADLRGAFDAVVTSVGCGWRKPDRRAFAAVGRRLGDPDLAALTHVGDDPRTDGGIVAAGGRFVRVVDADGTDGTAPGGDAAGDEDTDVDPALRTTLPSLASRLRSATGPEAEGSPWF
jgi:FMN phosphatase YigB (HAD superfamily)